VFSLLDDESGEEGIVEVDSVHPVVENDDCDNIDEVVVIVVVVVVVEEEERLSHLVCLLSMWLVVLLIGIRDDSSRFRRERNKPKLKVDHRWWWME